MSASTRRLRFLRSWASTLLIVGLAALLWPASLGGRVDYVLVSGESMEPGMHTGDLVLVRQADDYDVGDTVAYRIPQGEVGEGSVVIHRIAGGDAGGFVLQGDNRDQVDLWRPTADDVVGREWVLVPSLGNLVARLQAPAPLALGAAAMTFAMLAVPPRRRPAAA